MNEKSVSVIADGFQAALRVRKATFAAEVRRDILINRAVAEAKGSEEERTIAYVLHPRAVCAVDAESVIIYPDNVSVYAEAMTARQFGELPPEIAEAWLEAVWELNPRWVPGYGTQIAPEQEKKA